MELKYQVWREKEEKHRKGNTGTDSERHCEIIYTLEAETRKPKFL